MKPMKFLLLLATLFLLCAIPLLLSSCSEEEGEAITLYVYNWGEYISDGSEGSPDVNLEFEKYCERVLGKKAEEKPEMQDTEKEELLDEVANPLDEDPNSENNEAEKENEEHGNEN